MPDPEFKDYMRGTKSFEFYNFTSPRVVHYFHPDGQRWVFIRPRHLALISQSEARAPLMLTNQRPDLLPNSHYGAGPETKARVSDHR